MGACSHYIHAERASANIRIKKQHHDRLYRFERCSFVVVFDGAREVDIVPSQSTLVASLAAFCDSQVMFRDCEKFLP